MKELNSFHIDYFTSTLDFEEAFKMEIGKSIGKYHWAKLKYFYIGNIILIRDYKYGLDSLIQIIDKPREMDESDKEEAGVWYKQKWVASYKIIYRDKRPSDLKKRTIPKTLKDEILKKFNYQCQGILCPNCGYKCSNRFVDKGEFKPEFDHVIEFSGKGGLTNLDNLVPLCKGCHAMKTALFKRELINRLDGIKYSPNIMLGE